MKEHFMACKDYKKPFQMPRGQKALPFTRKSNFQESENRNTELTEEIDDEELVEFLNSITADETINHDSNEDLNEEAIQDEPGTSPKEKTVEVEYNDPPTSRSLEDWTKFPRFKHMKKDLDYLTGIFKSKGRPDWDDIWRHPPNPLLKKPEGNNYYLRKTLFWWPELFFQDLIPRREGKFMLPCAYCSSYGKSIRWNKNGPRLVSAMGESYFIITRQYECTSCNRLYLGYEENVLKKLHPEIKLCFPAVIFPKTCFDVKLVDYLEIHVRNGGSFRSLQKTLKEIDYLNYWRTKSMYLWHSVRYRKQRIRFGPVEQIKSFSKFEFVKGDSTYPGYIPTKGSLMKIYSKRQIEALPLKTKKMMGVKHPVLRIDHTFKTAQSARMDQIRPFKSMLNVMTGDGKIAGFYFCSSSSIAEVQDDLRRINERYSIDQPVQVLYTDRCCQDRATYEGIFPSLKVETGAKLEYDGFVVVASNNAEIAPIYDVMKNATGLALLIKRDEKGDPCVLSLQSTDKILDGTCYCAIFILSNLKRFPKELKLLLEDPHIVKIALESDDFTEICRHDWNTEIQNVELLAPQYESEFGNINLKYLAANKLGYEISVSQITSIQTAVTFDTLESLCIETLCIHLLHKAKDLSPGRILNTRNYQRILLDVFHFMDRYKLSKKHVYHPVFMATLRDAILLVDCKDMQDFHEVLTNRGYSYQEIVKMKSSYFVSTGRVKRRIPRGKILAARVDDVVQSFRVYCPDFITDEVMARHKLQMEHLEKGCLSDHPDVCLYQVLKEGDALHFKLLKCARSNSPLEGFHNHSYSNIGGRPVGVLILNLIAHDVCHVWNCQDDELDLNCYDISLLNSCYDAWNDNKELFCSSPLPKDYVPIRIDENEVLEQFGCTKAMDPNKFVDCINQVEDLDVDFDEDTPLEDLEHQLSDVLPPEAEMEGNLEVMPTQNLRQDILEKIKEYPLPMPVQTEEEMALIYQYYNDLASNRRTINYSVLANRYNSTIIERLKDNSADSVFSMYRFKNQYQVKGFMEQIFKKNKFKEAIGDNWGDLLSLQQRIRYPDFVPQIEAKPRVTIEYEPEQTPMIIVPEIVQVQLPVEPTELQAVVENRKIGASLKRKVSMITEEESLNSLKSRFGDELFELGWDSAINICAKCLGVAKEGAAFINDHSTNYCPNPAGDPTDNKKKINSLYQGIGRHRKRYNQ
jgi:hypothetical protein